MIESSKARTFASCAQSYGMLKESRSSRPLFVGFMVRGGVGKERIGCGRGSRVIPSVTVAVPHGGDERGKKRRVYCNAQGVRSLAAVLYQKTIMIVTDILFPHRSTPSDTDIASVTLPSQSRNPSILIHPRYPSSMFFYLLPGHSKF